MEGGSHTSGSYTETGIYPSPTPGTAAFAVDDDGPTFAPPAFVPPTPASSPTPAGPPQAQAFEVEIAAEPTGPTKPTLAPTQAPTQAGTGAPVLKDNTNGAEVEPEPLTGAFDDPAVTGDGDGDGDQGGLPALPPVVALPK